MLVYLYSQHIINTSFLELYPKNAKIYHVKLCIRHDIIVQMRHIPLNKIRLHCKKRSTYPEEVSGDMAVAV